MNTHHDASLYTQFCAFAQQFTYAAEDAIMEKVDAILQDQVKSQQVKAFTRLFDADTYHYLFQIQMTELTIAKVWRTFRNLHQYIDLGVGMYAMEEENEEYHYLLVSLRDNATGIYCEIDFIP